MVTTEEEQKVNERDRWRDITERLHDHPIAGGQALQEQCWDCGVLIGAEHRRGCDVARCRGCGRQALSCDRPECVGIVRQTVHTGLWPGSEEIADGYAADFNDLLIKVGRGQLRWDQEAERFVPAD